MAFIEITRKSNGVSTVFNERVIHSVYTDTHKFLTDSGVTELQDISEGEYILALNMAKSSIYFSYKVEEDCLAAYQSVKQALSPKEIQL